MTYLEKKGSITCGTLLVTGTCIGTSFLSIPVVTGIAGFFPGSVMSLVIWLFTLACGLLYAEAVLGNPDGANLYTITKTYLGKSVAIVASIIFLFDLYAYISASCISSANFFNWASYTFLGIETPLFLGRLLVICLLGAVVFYGVLFSSRVNFVLVASLLIAFILAMYHGMADIEAQHLVRRNWVYIFYAAPIIFNSFGFNEVIPTLCTYLNRDRKKITIAITTGVTLTLVVYLFWQWVMIGSLAKSPLWVAFAQGDHRTNSFPWVKKFPQLVHALNFVIFFAATTSIIAISLSLVDFFSDCFKIPLKKRVGKKRFLVCLLVFFPILLITAALERDFIPRFVDYVVSPFGGIIIYGILPLFLIAKARYFLKVPTRPMIPGKGYALFILGFYLFFLIYLQGVMLIR